MNEEPFQLVDMPDGKAIISTENGVRINEAPVEDAVQSHPLDVRDEKSQNRPDAATYTSMCEISDMESRDSYDQSVHTDVRRVQMDDTLFGCLDDDAAGDDSVTRYARLVLLTLKYVAPSVRCAPSIVEPPDTWMTQLIIDSHVAVVARVIDLGQIEPTPRDVITYVCGSFEQSGVSTLAGAPWRALKYSDQVMSVLAVARAVVGPLWSSYDDAVYAECHRQLDKQALFHVQAKYQRRRRPQGGCCIVI